ncbi:MAG: CapA family protein [Bacteroidetes bacterium]|jgi:poly-gamma-glutamate synthesis protein (capsule biosynthesis protein)|nr:CapA family protein [Bacteroidota bacterium]
MLAVSWLVVAPVAFAQRDTTGVELLAFGDVNLGRTVGQRILAGDTMYAFRGMMDRMKAAEIVFLNLESQLSDQKGQTVHPRNNLIFTGPPAGADALSIAGIDVVSTANNHAFDYGLRGLRETIMHLDRAGIAWTGTGPEPDDGFPPAIVERDSILIGFVAFTEFVNAGGPWEGHVALFDSSAAARAVKQLRSLVDVVVASYHGGGEYGQQISGRSRAQMRWLAECGAAIVIGHHPHVPYGIERWKGSWIALSLGNFVFGQPQHYWTQIGLAASFRVRREGDGVRVGEPALLPFRAAMQPSWDLTPADQDSVWHRVTKGSSLHFRREQDIIHVSAEPSP